MKITRQTPQQLIIGDNPIVIAIILGAALLIFAGISLGMIFSGDLIGFAFALTVPLLLLFMYFFVRRVQLIFNADDGTLTIQRKNLRRSLKVVHDLTDIDRAIVETSSSDNTTTYRVTLVLTGQSAGHHPITRAYSNIGDHKGVKDAINAWLDSYRAHT